MSRPTTLTWRGPLHQLLADLNASAKQAQKNQRKTTPVHVRFPPDDLRPEHDTLLGGKSQ